MKRTSEQTLGKHLAAAQNFANDLAGFKNFKAPADDISLESFNQIIAAIKASDADAVAKKSDWSLTIKERQELFDKEGNSMLAMVRPIKLAVKAQYGVHSKHADHVNAHVKAISSNRAKKQQSDKTDAVATDAVKAISRSQRSKDSVIKYFSDMVTAIAQFTPAFDPGNQAISMPQLLQKHLQLTSVSEKLNDTYAAWKTARGTRDMLFSKLKDCFIRIKSAVESQYGSNSTEFSLLKPIVL